MKYTPKQIRLVSFVALLIYIVTVIKGQTCGGFIEAKSPSDTGTIESPNYPSNYDNYTNCIWLIQAPANYNVYMSIPNGMLGESNCDDFLDIRNGSSQQTQLYYGCLDSAPATVQSVQRWLWIRFFSDDTVSNTGFTASWNLLYDSVTTVYNDPIADCQSVHYSCPNKECISWSYRCDGQPDCGCTGSGCDEHECGGLGLSEPTIIGIGVSVGFVTFTVIFLGIGFLEIYVKNRSEKDYQRKVKEAKIRARKRKNKGDTEVKRQESVSDRSRPSTASPSRRQSTLSATNVQK